MALALLKKVATNALNTVGNAAGSAFNYLQKNAPEIIQQGLESTPMTLPFSERGQQGIANAGRFLQKMPDTTLRAPETPEFVKSTPLAGLFQNPLTDVNKGITEFLTSIPGEMIRETGQALELSATPEGREAIGGGIQQYPEQFADLFSGQGEGGRLGTTQDLLANPATITAFGLTNIPSPKNLIKKGVQEVAEQGVKQTAKKGTQELIEQGTKQAVKNPNLIDDITGEVTERFFKPKGSTNQLDFIADEMGNLKPVKEASKKKTGELFQQLPPTETVDGGFGGLLDTPKQPLSLPQPQNSVSITQLKQLAKQGDNLEGVNFVAKNADEAREALKLGVPNSRVSLAKKADNSTQKLFQGEDGLSKTADPNKEWIDLETEAAMKSGGKKTSKGTARKIWEDVARSSKGVIGRSGRAGKQIVKLVDEAEKEADLLSGGASATLKNAMKGLDDVELNSLADVIEGNAKAISPRQQAAVDAWKTIADDVAKRAQDAGIDMGIRENYFPHQVLKEFEKEARALGRMGERRFANLEAAREANLPYNKDPRVMFDYIDNAYGRVADAKYFGTDDSILYKLADAAGTQGGDRGQITKYLDQMLGKNQSVGMGKDISGKLTTAQTVAKLNPATSVLNLTQNISTMLRTDVPSVAKAVGRTIKNPDKAFDIARKTGQIPEDMAKELGDFAGTGNVASKWIRLIGMRGTERFNRVVAVNAATEYATKLAKQASKGSKAAIRELDRLGIDASKIKNGTLSDENLKAIGRSISKETQFSTKPGELPYGWRTNAGKVITQFKSFAYKQTGFVKDQAKRIGSEAKQGNVKPLVNALVVYGIAAPIAGEIVNDFRSLIRNKEREDADSLTERYFSNILAASSFGLLDSTGGLLGEYGLGGVVSTVGGVTVGDAWKVGESAIDIGTGLANYDTDKSVNENLDPWNRAKRLAVRNIPAVGQLLANTLIPNSYVDNLDVFGQNLGVNTESKSASEDSGLFGMFKGKDRTPESINKEYFDGKSYSTATRTEKQKILNKMIDIAEDEEMTPEEKVKIANAVGVTSSDLKYYRTASMGQEDRLEGLLELASTEHESRDELMTELMLGKRSVGGKSLFSTAMFDRLYDEGLISKEEKSLIAAVKYDPIFNRFYMDRDYKGGGSGGSSASKVKSYITSINALFKEPIRAVQTDKALQQASEPIEAPKLNFGKVSRPSNRSSQQWFNSY